MENNDYDKNLHDQDTVIDEPWSYQFENEEEQTTRASRHTKTKESGLYSKIIFTVFGLIVAVIAVWALMRGLNLIGGTSQQGSTTPAVPKLVLQSQTTTTAPSSKADEQSTSSTQANQSSSTQSTTSATNNASTQGTYTIVSGDSAYSIASNHGMTVSEFYALNGFSESTLLLPGQTVKVSSGSTTSSRTNTTTPATNNTSVGSYTIQSGDSIYSIAESHGMTPSEFKQLNGLTDDSLLLPGTVVKVNVN
ncbi:LysM peptidoglycan-binding domain-containing protein [Carnobacteriaceae bacterium zg-ZUI240]|nr:LysM peptidoglycan-binding domain-containing protein [Carnobacteriaceae bacterium zg-ZUI240]